MEIKGANGESIVFDGATVAKFRHDGKQEAARNAASTFRDLTFSQKTSLFGKVKDPAHWDALLAMGSFMSLTVDDEGRAALEQLAAQLRDAAG